MSYAGFLYGYQLAAYLADVYPILLVFSVFTALAIFSTLALSVLTALVI